MKTTKEKRERERLKKEKLKVRELARKTKKQFSRKRLNKEADDIFSLYIRWRDAWKPCCTCWTQWEERFQCGHFISRAKKHTTWLEINAHWQCYRCNMILKWMQYEHSFYVDKVHGKWTAEKIRQLSMSIDKVTDSEILETIQHYYQKCFELWIDYKHKKQFLWI